MSIRSRSQSVVLVVDDSALDRRFAGKLLEDARYAVQTAVDGSEAIQVLAKEPIDLVLTDLQMPEITGLQLVEHIRVTYPVVPVILMTAYGSEDIAVQALQKGAASYVPKQNLARDLVSTVRDVLSVAHAEREEKAILDRVTEAAFRYELEPNTLRIPPMIGHLQSQLQRFKLCDEADMVRVGTALQEALVNAVEHGNLELDSRLRDEPNRAYYRLASERSLQLPYSERRVHVYAKFSREEAHFIIRDEGPGYDVESLPDPTQPGNIGKVSGRGLFLIRTFMDHVAINPTGNEITMIKRRKRAT